MINKAPHDIPQPKRNLSDEDKQFIKQVVLKNAEKGLGLLPEELAYSLIKAIKMINDY